MDNENIRAVVDNALVDNASAMKDALHSAINDKVMAAIDQRKIAVAASMLTPAQQQNEVEDNEE